MNDEDQKLIEAKIAKFRHTKGKWHIKNNHIDTDLEEKGRTGGYGHDHHFICDFDDYEYHTYDDKGEQLANMLLVQAAPDMLKALIYACVKCDKNRYGIIPPMECTECPVRKALLMIEGVSEGSLPEEWRDTFDEMHRKHE